VQAGLNLVQDGFCKQCRYVKPFVVSLSNHERLNGIGFANPSSTFQTNIKTHQNVTDVLNNPSNPNERFGAVEARTFPFVLSLSKDERESPDQPKQ